MVDWQKFAKSNKAYNTANVALIIMLFSGLIATLGLMIHERVEDPTAWINWVITLLFILTLLFVIINTATTRHLVEEE